MTDARIKGAISSSKGTVNEGVGKLTGNKKLEVKGKLEKGLGKAQTGVGDFNADSATATIAADAEAPLAFAAFRPRIRGVVEGGSR